MSDRAFEFLVAHWGAALICAGVVMCIALLLWRLLQLVTWHWAVSVLAVLSAGGLVAVGTAVSVQAYVSAHRAAPEPLDLNVTGSAFDLLLAPLLIIGHGTAGLWSLDLTLGGGVLSALVIWGAGLGALLYTAGSRRD